MEARERNEGLPYGKVQGLGYVKHQILCMNYC